MQQGFGFSVSIFKMFSLLRTLRSPRGGVAAMRMAHSLPELGYGYADLEPTISEEIMTLHHSKHHQARFTLLPHRVTTLCNRSWCM